jgi:hypothetical protein
VDLDALSREFELLLALGALPLVLLYDVLWGFEELALVENFLT